LIPDREWCDIFEEEAGKADPMDIPAIANLIINFFRSEAARNAQPTAGVRNRIPVGEIAKLAASVRQRVILSTAVASVSSTMVSTGFTVEAIVAQQGLGERADQNELEQWCRDAIAGNAKALSDFKSGKESAINGFKGPVMKAAKGKADPKLVDHMLRRLLAEM
jgi:aspartyl-tRNA(Asn)/glutamyl-tRNA(Gln) amidotransferase subunit B